MPVFVSRNAKIRTKGSDVVLGPFDVVQVSFGAFMGEALWAGTMRRETLQGYRASRR